jgi:hypothetical protein
MIFMPFDEQLNSVQTLLIYCLHTDAFCYLTTGLKLKPHQSKPQGNIF